MAEVASAFVSLVPSTKNWSRQINSQVGSQLDRAGTDGGKRFGAAFSSVAKVGLLAGGLAVAGFAKAVIGSASDAQQSIGATETVFGKFSKNVISNSNAAAKQYGLSANTYRESANLIGSLFKNQGVTTDQLAGKTKAMIGIGADLAATFGGTTTTAVEALGSAFKGEFDSLEKYGVSLKESTVSALLAKRGQDKLTGSSLAAAKQQAITDLIMRQSKDSLGAFGKESNTLSGQQQRLGASFENIKATLGTALLPIMTKLATIVNAQVLPAITKAISFLQANPGVVYAFGAAVGALAVAFIAAQIAAFAVPLAIAALVAGVVYAYTKFETFRTIVDAAFNAIKAVVSAVLPYVVSFIRGQLDVIMGVVKVFSSLFKGDWQGVWDGIKQIVSGIVVQIKAVISGWAASVGALIRGLGSTIKTAASSAFQGLKDKAVEKGESMLRYIGNLPGKILTSLGNVAGLLYDAGKYLIQGFINGIKEKGEDLLGAIKDIAVDAPVRAIQKGLNMGSPSKLFRQFGVWTMEGFINGITAKVSAVTKRMESVSALIAKGLDKNDISKSMAKQMTRVVGAVQKGLEKVKTLTDEMKSFGAEVGGKFLNDLFNKGIESGTGLQALRTQLAEDTFNATAMTAALKQAAGKGLSGGLFKQAAASGDLSTTQQIAALSAKEIRQLEVDFYRRNKASTNLSNLASNVAYDAKVSALLAKYDKTLNDLADRVGVEVYDGARAGIEGKARRARQKERSK